MHPVRRRFALAAVALGTLITPLDTSVNIAFPYIVAAFDEPLAMIRWVVISYVLTYASLMLVFGKLGDLFGYRLVFAIGLLISIGALLLVSVSPGFGSLLFFRFLQGVGAGLLTSVGPALVIGLYPAEQRGRAIATFTVIFAVGSMLGPSLGGQLVAWFDWRAVFWFRAPIAALSFIALFALPAPSGNAERRPYDLAGAISLIVAMSSFLLAINEVQEMDRHGPLPVIVLGVVFVVASGCFIRSERRADEPILDLRLFRRLDFVITNLASCLVYFAGFSVMLLVPFLLARIEGLSVTTAGLVLASGFVGVGLSAMAGGRFVDRIRANRLACIGIAMTGCGLLAVSLMDVRSSLGWLVAALLVQGVGTGLFQVSYLYIVTGCLPASQRGVAGSLAMLTRTIGVVSGVATLTMTFVAIGSGARELGASEAESFQDGFRGAFLLAGGGLLVFLLATMVRPRIWFGRSSGPDGAAHSAETGVRT